MQTIELHIERLMLHGFSPGARHGIGRAVERELTRLLTERGVSNPIDKGGEFAQLDGGRFTMDPNPGAEEIGSRVAQQVYESMNFSQTRQER